jgi:hypothetical protein
MQEVENWKVPLASGNRWAAIERRRKQHDRWKSVTDRRITLALASALTSNFSPSSTILNRPTYRLVEARWI